MKPIRLFVTDENVVTLCNGTKDGLIVFESAEDFKRITGDDLPHEDYICYEPDDGQFHDDHDSSITPNDIPNTLYEKWIGNAAIYKVRLADPTYGKVPAQIAGEKLILSKGKLQSVVYTLIENDGRAKLKKLKTMPAEAEQKMIDYAAQLEHYISVLVQSIQGTAAADEPDMSDEPSDEPTPIINPVDTIIPVDEAINLAEPVWPFLSEPGDTSLWW